MKICHFAVWQISHSSLRCFSEVVDTPFIIHSPPHTICQDAYSHYLNLSKGLLDSCKVYQVNSSLTLALPVLANTIPPALAIRVHINAGHPLIQSPQISMSPTELVLSMLMLSAMLTPSISCWRLSRIYPQSAHQLTTEKSGFWLSCCSGFPSSSSLSLPHKSKSAGFLASAWKP